MGCLWDFRQTQMRRIEVLSDSKISMLGALIEGLRGLQHGVSARITHARILI